MKVVIYEAHKERQPLTVVPAAGTTRCSVAPAEVPRHMPFILTGTTSGFQLLGRDTWGMTVAPRQAFAVAFRSDSTQTGFFHNPADMDVTFRMKIEESIAMRVQKEKNKGAVALLRTWLDSRDEREVLEQSETIDFLSWALDEDRFSSRKLFR